ncbi:MAG: ferritin family protein [Armatimonadota bacterium]|nr:ferritin family protein [Armatimonadota bacterium]
MPAFSDPFYGNVPPKKLTLGELIRAIRLNIAAEEEAAAVYEAHAEATDNPLARKVLLDIANEERVHVGEFVELLDILTKQEEKAWMEQGYEEVRELAEEVARGDVEPASPAEKAAEASGAAGEQTTIGSLKED